MQTKSATVIPENLGPVEIYWYSDSSNDLIKSSISISTEIYTSKFILQNDEEETITTIEPKEEYLLKCLIDEP